MFLYKQNLDALLTFLVYVISLWSTKCLRTHTHASENNRIFSVDKILRAHFGGFAKIVCSANYCIKIARNSQKLTRHVSHKNFSLAKINKQTKHINIYMYIYIK